MKKSREHDTFEQIDNNDVEKEEERGYGEFRAFVEAIDEIGGCACAGVVVPDADNHDVKAHHHGGVDDEYFWEVARCPHLVHDLEIHPSREDLGLG